MAKHRKKCGVTSRLTTPGEIYIKNEEKDETIEKVHIIESVNVAYSANEDQNAVNTIYTWATDEQCGSDQQQHVIQVEKVHQPAPIVEMVHQIQQEEPSDHQPRHDRMDSRKNALPTIKKLSRRSTNSSLLDANLSRFIIGCNLSFDIVDSPYFKKFALTMNSDYAVPSSAQLKSRVLNQLQTLDPLPVSKSRKRRYEEVYPYSESESDD